MLATDTAIPNLRDIYQDEERAARVDELHADLVERGVKHVYFQYVTVQARVLGKVVPVSFWPKAARKGLAWAYIVAGGFHADTADVPIGEGGPATKEGVMVPDLETLTVLPWDPEVARVFCSHFRRLEDKESGEPVETDARQLLRRAAAELQESLGVRATSGCEPEMSWFAGPEAVDASASRLADNVSPSYHIRHLEDVRRILKKVTEYAAAMGFEMLQADYEDPSQLECNWGYDDFLATADRVVTYRQICMQVAEELGILATFMPKPVEGIMANGCHHHISFWQDDQNLLIDPEATGRDNLSDHGRQAVGGLLTHASGMSAVLSPTVNSYKRFTEANWSPEAVNWGYDNRACAIRVVPGRLELRLPDASVNPYLSHVAILAAVKDGWDRKLDPGPAQEGFTPEPGGENGSGPTFDPLPWTLEKALDAFERDEVISGALPAGLREVFLACKRDEWLRFCGSVTDWDLRTYLNYVP
jgi:glutamine synthetase